MKMSQKLQSIMKELANQEDDNAFQEAWRRFFFKAGAVRKLSADMTSNLALPLLTAGQC